ncbi:Alpha-ketoglutarate-dependent sulfonate dioxygenase [Spathaspora sp. JA1]|nr:Alpha-ketoglutarate-dependent sulfonate dioxygenase [Spathaspora sp. JA1]
MAPVRYVQHPRALYSGSKLETDAKGLVVVAPESRSKISKDVEDYLPTWRKDEHYEPYKFHEYHDPALRADPSFSNLLAGAETKNISPKLGTEVKGVQLSQLTDAGKDELALLAHQRGVVVFRDQDFVSKGPEHFVDYIKYFGNPHIHPTSGRPKDVANIHVVLSGDTTEDPFTTRTNLVGFHSDVSYELQPTALSFLTVTNLPVGGGGDTVFLDSAEAYNRLSPLFREKLENLNAVHSAVEQANYSIVKGGVVRRHPVENAHPIVRTTPLGKKVLFVNKGFTRRIEGLKVEESDAILNFLFDHVAKSHDLQIRANWEKNTVVVFDNRVVNHSAILDFDTTESRLIARASAQGERPVHDLKDLNKPDESTLFEGPEYLGNKIADLKLA